MKKNTGKPEVNSNTLIPKLLLKTEEVCQCLNTGAKTALRLLTKHELFPIDLGKGRGNGLRWHYSEVIKLADILHAEAQPVKVKRNRQSSQFKLTGKTAAELYAEFNGNRSVNAEVCNGN